MRELLPWLIPPLAGAIIGYVTNAIAIKMLFRPLREYRIFGIRVPFTPGILPRQRHKLAQSIGGMVERELLTPEILRERLARENVRESLKTALSGYTSKLFTFPIGDGFPHVSDFVFTAASALYPRAVDKLMAFLRQEEIREQIETQSHIMISKVMLKMNLFQRFFISAGQYDKSLSDNIPGLIEDLLNQVEHYFRSEEGEQKILEKFEHEIRTLIAKNPELNLEKFLALNKTETGASIKTRLDTFLAEKILDAAASQTEAFLAVINVKTLVSERIDSLEMLRVERIILDVLADQLQWINIFGAILGALIGLFQSVLSLLLR